MSIPSFRDDGWLPEGHHAATWEEIADTLGGEPDSIRAKVFAGLLAWRDAVRAKRLSGLVILDGSFVSAKPDPGDFDLLFVYDVASEEVRDRDPKARELLDMMLCKTRYGGDVVTFSENTARQYPQFFPLDTFDLVKVTMRPKGVLEVRI